MSWDAYVRPLQPVNLPLLWVLGRRAANIPGEWPWSVNEESGSLQSHGGCEQALAIVSLHNLDYDEETRGEHGGWAIFILNGSSPTMMERTEHVVWNLMAELALLGIPCEWGDPQAGTWTTDLPDPQEAV